MKSLLVCFFSVLLGGNLYAQNIDSLTIRRIYDEALGKGDTYKNLHYLCKSIGSRLSGSANAARAVQWSKGLLEQYGFQNVHLQEVMVPHWERGEKEKAVIIEGQDRTEVRIAALGGSVSTPPGGIITEVIEVQNFEELRRIGDQVKGKIVFFNRPFDASLFDTFEAYSGAVNQRSQGAIEAAKLGAVAVIVRSMSSIIDDNPHTGGMRYQDGVTRIPAAAISTYGAELLSRKLKSRKLPALKFHFIQHCITLPDALSHNVVAELRGTETPENVIVVGGHLDSWDLAEGAHDDGAGVTQSIEVLRILKSLNLRPKNTIRVVLFMNEENGLRGGLKYAEIAKQKKEKHIAAIESDEGGFTPRGFTIEDSPTAMSRLKAWRSLLEPYKVTDLLAGDAGADIGPLKSAVPGITLIGYKPDSQRYFDIHHASSDVFEQVNKRELELGAASMASLVYLIDKYGLQ